MKDYLVSLGVVSILSAFAKMIMPEGGIKKFASLTIGFMVIATILSPVPIKVSDFYIEEESEEINLSVAEAKYKADVLLRHRENINSMIEEKMIHNSKAFAEVNDKGEVFSVTIHANGDESQAVHFIVTELKVPRERINIINETDK